MSFRLRPWMTMAICSALMGSAFLAACSSEKDAREPIASKRSGANGKVDPKKKFDPERMGKVEGDSFEVTEAYTKLVKYLRPGEQTPDRLYREFWRRVWDERTEVKSPFWSMADMLARHQEGEKLRATVKLCDDRRNELVTQLELRKSKDAQKVEQIVLKVSDSCNQDPVEAATFDFTADKIDMTMKPNLLRQVFGTGMQFHQKEPATCSLVMKADKMESLLCKNIGQNKTSTLYVVAKDFEFVRAQSGRFHVAATKYNENGEPVCGAQSQEKCFDLFIDATEALEKLDPTSPEELKKYEKDKKKIEEENQRTLRENAEFEAQEKKAAEEKAKAEAAKKAAAEKGEMPPDAASVPAPPEDPNATAPAATDSRTPSQASPANATSSAPEDAARTPQPGEPEAEAVARAANADALATQLRQIHAAGPLDHQVP